jgi:hypothetical protein
MENSPPTKEELQQKALEEVRKFNPGTEVWLGELPKTGDWWIYRAAAKPEARIYDKTLTAEKAKGDSADLDVAFRVLIDTCVLFPPKAKDDRWTAENNPSGDTIEKLLGRRTMVAPVIVGEIREVSGWSNEVIQKKL